MYCILVFFFLNNLFYLWIQIPAVPVIFALRNALFLEPPSQAQQQFAKSAEEERSHMTELEFKMLLKKKKSSTSEEPGDQEPGDSSDENEDISNKIVEDLKKNSAKRKADVKDKVQFKRKRAKVLVFNEKSITILSSKSFC